MIIELLIVTLFVLLFLACLAIYVQHEKLSKHTTRMDALTRELSQVKALHSLKGLVEVYRD
ncbi:hypothetical protein [Bowmanella denitrificans]|uniref:hypothetical protein n=1 Tax=Bowmanella denitrificans TaxID=366582 RepID=UPI000C9B7EE3|nr:hypothetical protein [Bowmanella denitrificans]